MVDFSNMLNLPGGISKGGPKTIVKGLVISFITLATALYIISPIDLMPGLPFDDILVGIAGFSTILALMGKKLPKLN